MQIVLATRNRGKVEELGVLLCGLDVDLSSLADHPGIGEIDEDGATFLDNARKKARTVAAAIPGAWALADDSGLVVDALGGAPGVHSARYAGRQGDYAANNQKLLLEMRSVPRGKRQAAFVCTMLLLAPDGREWVAEGRCEGEIGMELRGSMGFGFDPLFVVPGLGKTMAELPLEQKNRISHRGRALERIRKILIEISTKN